MRRVSVFLALLLCNVYFTRHVNGARILAIFPLEIPHQFFFFQEILWTLVEQGHKLDVISHYPLIRPHPNYENIIHLTGKGPRFTFNLTADTLDSLANKPVEYYAEQYGNKACELLALPEFKKLIEEPQTNPPYDLVITELLYANCYFAFGRHFKVPVVAVSMSALPPYISEPLGNPVNTAFVSEHIDGSILHMNFWQRFKNTLHTWWTNYRIRRVTEAQNSIVKTHFGPDMPDIRELERDLSLLLVNSHHSLNGVRPFTPAIVEIGGLHVRDDGTELPEELKAWLDSSADGFIFVSFGSLLAIENFPKDIIAELYSALAKIAPIRVLLKGAAPEALPPGIPTNVLALEVVSQTQVLKHGNIRAFVMQGGSLEIHEAVMFAVPFIGLPIFPEPQRNVKNCVEKGVAISMDFGDFTADKFTAAVSEIVSDAKYKNNIITLGGKFLDRPRSPLETAIFWIEYILRNGGDSLRSPAVKFSWWQLALLDIYAGITVAVIVVIYICKRLTLTVIRRLFRPHPTLPTSKKMV
ncbi:UDP-glucosyltransferase 2-like [Neodiprion fabricii]|uniref:UDP-glucosyltransferase 2-like n=1 Tax=Neodiprion fabricii TaxID=2872261 RepID=UPI001ED9227F|nr:UDP-glucosyltransferase 2-like [Neodiprion fabricii]